MKIKALFLITMLLGSVVLTGCNTVRGVGEDLERAGEAIQRQSDRADD